MSDNPKETGASNSNPESDKSAARRKKSPPVVKTILEINTEGSQVQVDGQSNATADQLGERRKKGSAVNPTISEAETKQPESIPPESQTVGAGNDSLDDRRKRAPTVDKTKLDMDAVLDMATKTVAEKDEKLREELDARPLEPTKPFQPIEKFRYASPCQSSWDKMTGSDSVRFCEKCKLQVYDFSKTEPSKAEEIIFKREGTKNFSLYKRRDGKYLTSDCPVALRNKQTLMVAGIVAVLLVMGCYIVLISMPPPPTANLLKEANQGGRAVTVPEETLNTSGGSPSGSGPPSAHDAQEQTSGDTELPPMLPPGISSGTQHPPILPPGNSSISPIESTPTNSAGASAIPLSTPPPSAAPVAQPTEPAPNSQDSVSPSGTTPPSGIWQRPGG